LFAFDSISFVPFLIVQILEVHNFMICTS